MFRTITYIVKYLASGSVKRSQDNALDDVLKTTSTWELRWPRFTKYKWRFLLCVCSSSVCKCEEMHGIIQCVLRIITNSMFSVYDVSVLLQSHHRLCFDTEWKGKCVYWWKWYTCVYMKEYKNSHNLRSYGIVTKNIV